MNDIVKPCRAFRNSLGYFIPGPINVEKKSLNDDLDINLLRIFEVDPVEKKRYIRSFGILINKTLFAMNVKETETFITELSLFERGDKNNNYFNIVSKDSVISLKLISENINIYITKSQAKSMIEYFNKLNKSYNLSYAYEHEVELTIDGYNYFLSYDPHSMKKYSEEEEMKRFKEFC